MATNRKHIVFIDDSADEVQTFQRLYSGDKFKVTAVQAQGLSKCLQQVSERLAGEVPDLFVLDLFYPEADDAPRELGAAAAPKVREQIQAVIEAASALPGYFAEGDRLLKEGHGVVVESQRLLSELCRELRQSPAGGIRLLGDLSREYPGVPKVFYSRKATVGDVKWAMREGAVDVLLKPHPSVENREAGALMEDFERYCARQPSSWIARWMEHLPGWASEPTAKFLAQLATRPFHP